MTALPPDYEADGMSPDDLHGRSTREDNLTVLAGVILFIVVLSVSHVRWSNSPMSTPNIEKMVYSEIRPSFTRAQVKAWLAIKGIESKDLDVFERKVGNARYLPAGAREVIKGRIRGSERGLYCRHEIEILFAFDPEGRLVETMINEEYRGL